MGPVAEVPTTAGMVSLVKRVNANSQLIDGVGTQMHLSVRHSCIMRQRWLN